MRGLVDTYERDEVTIDEKLECPRKKFSDSALLAMGDGKCTWQSPSHSP